MELIQKETWQNKTNIAENTCDSNQCEVSNNKKMS